MLYKQKKSKNWWYRFSWNGRIVRESTKQENRRVALQIEAARKTQLAKGEVGIKDPVQAPTLEAFATGEFLPFVESRSKDKPNTVRFYKNSVKNLTSYPKLGEAPLDEIGTDLIAKYIAFRRRGDVEVATINRELATLRRAFHLAQEWGRVDRLLPRVKMLPGENRREQVLSPEDEAKYLEAAAPLLRDVATILIDCALRPEEAFRLRWEQVRDGAIEIFRGKAKGSRRRVPCSERVLAAIERRRGSGCDWVFPAPTKSGHIEASSLKKQHAHAVEESKVPSFVLYVLRHTCITRWSRHMDPYTLHVIAGHADMNTTKRYVHPSDADVRAAMDRARTANTSGPSAGDTATPPR